MKPSIAKLLSVVFVSTVSASHGASLSLFETPRDGNAPVISAISKAKKGIDVEVYELTDEKVIDALIERAKAGVSVRAILNHYGAKSDVPNQAAYSKLSENGVQVQFSSPKFKFTHEKAIIVDAGTSGQEVLIMTLNLGPGYIDLNDPDIRGQAPQGASLNFGIVDKDSKDVGVVEDIFNADWDNKHFSLNGASSLAVSPLNSRDQLTGQINSAQKTFHFFAQELGDSQIINALKQAAVRGVEVKGLVSENLVKPAVIQALSEAGVEIKVLKNPYEHAKAAIADSETVYIGSINYTKTSMDSNRELGIVTAQTDIAKKMETEFSRFWATSVASK